MEVDLPVPLGIGGQGQVDPGQLPGHVLGHQPLVVGGGALARGLPPLDGLPEQLGVRALRHPPLLVVRALEREVVGIRRVEQERHEGVPAAVLVDVGRPVPDPLPRHEDGHADVELELHHLAGRGVLVAAEVADEAPGLAHLPGPVAVADPGRPLDVLVAAHVVDQRHEAVVEDGEVAAEDLLGRGDGGALGLGHGRIVGFRCASGQREVGPSGTGIMTSLASGKGNPARSNLVWKSDSENASSSSSRYSL